MHRALMVGCLLLAIVAAPARAQDRRFDRSGLYVASSDLAASTSFYSTLLDRQPTLSLPSFVAFDVAGGLFAVIDGDAYGPSRVQGATVTPYISVRDIEAEYARVRHLMPDRIVAPGLIVEGPISLFKITAPDGVVVEFYKVAPQQP